MNSETQKNRAQYEKIYSHGNLFLAWQKVQSNGLQSTLKETRDLIKAFNSKSMPYLLEIQKELKTKKYTFSPARGVFLKREGKSPRPIVMPPIRDRIVQRAILQILQNDSRIRDVIDTPYSFGGLKEKNVELAVNTVQLTMNDGFSFFIKSDVKQFFTKIDKVRVVNFLKERIDDTDVIDLLENAIKTQLCAEDMDYLGEDSALFPLEETGVAQGSCLSPLIANIYLGEFDQLMNKKGIKCFRYIDDLLLFGVKNDHLKKAFQNGKKFLEKMQLEVYDPFLSKGKFNESGKSSHGRVENGFEFLGCQVFPGLTQPSKKNRNKFIARISKAISDSKGELRSIGKRQLNRKKTYISTMSNINNMVLGWGNAFSFCNDYQVMEQLDKKIFGIIQGYILFVQKIIIGDPDLLVSVLGLYSLKSILNEKALSVPKKKATI